MPEKAIESRVNILFLRVKALVFSRWGRASNWLLSLAIFLLPFFVLPYTVLPAELNKSYLAYFAVILATVFYLASRLKEGRVLLPKNLLLAFLLGLLCSLAISSVFSLSPQISFLGFGNEPGTFSAIALFVLTLFLSAVLLNTEREARGVFLVLFGSFLVLFLFQVFQTFLGIPPLSWLGADPTANLFGSWNELGIFSGLLVLMSLLFVNFSPSPAIKFFAGLILLCSLILAAVVNLFLVWVVLAGFLAVLLAYLYSQKWLSQKVFRLPLAVLIVALLFISARPLAVEFVNWLGIQFIEVRPDWPSTLQVVRETARQHGAFGSGPNTFLYDWLSFRPADVASTPFWQLRFNSGVGFLPTLAATTGFAGIFFWAGFLILFLWYGFKTLLRQEAEISFLLLTSFLGALYLWVAALFFSAGFVSLFFAFLLSGMFLGLATSKGALKSVTVSLFERSGTGFLAALFFIFFMVLGISWLSIQGQKYYAAILYGKGISFFNQGDLDRAERDLLAAVRFDRQDRYFRSLTEVGLSRLQGTARRGDLSPEELRFQFQQTLGATIQHAQSATSQNPIDPLNWMNLGRVYEAIVPFQVQGAADFAENAYAEALKHFPSGPEPYLASARVELLQNDLPQAREFLKKAIELKSDYAPAHFLLAQLEAQTGNVDLAIESAETTALLAPGDVGVLFQLGLLYYQSQRFNDAKVVLERAVSLNDNYSNARYFLGLIHSREGEREKALKQFLRIQELNPANDEVKRIIENLRQGREALFGISPPEPSPEKRSRTPIEE